VGANLDIMRADTERMRPNRAWVMTNLKTKDGLADVISFIETKGMLKA
jgi:urease accessory protein